MEVKIKNNGEMLDATIEMVDGVMVVSPKVEKYVPKDGDVVVQSELFKWILIYRDCMTVEVYEYVSLDVEEDKIRFPNGGHIGYVDTLRPATEEEKMKLFDKLKEEGYEWDAKMKEIVKLKWKPEIGETYYRPNFSHCQFVCYSGTADYNKIIYVKDYISKGWIFRTKEECEGFCHRLNDAINFVKP